MEEILKSKLLEYDKSTFLIDLIKHKSGAKYVSIQQKIESTSVTQEIKINASVLEDVIHTLENYLTVLSGQPRVAYKAFFPEDRQDELVKRYLKGLNIEDLMLQFNCPRATIEQILHNKDIEVVDNKLPNHLKSRRRKKRK
jgi:hypothetical protein